MNTLTNLKIFDKKIINVTETIFKIFFFIYAATSYCSVTYGHPVISFLMWPAILLGGIVLLQRLVLFKKYKSMPILLPCIAFTLCMGISILANFSYDLKLNIILLGYFIFYFFILFVQDTSATLEKIKQEMRFFSFLFIAYMTIAIIASFAIMFAGFGSVTKVNADNFEVIVGFVNGRLWGVFPDPNVGATFSLASIAMMLCFILRSKKLWIKVLLWINIVIHMLYITFSDSRTPLVCFLIIPICAATIYAMSTDKKNKLHFVKSTLASVLVTVLCFTFVYSAKYSYNSIMTKINTSQSETSQDTPEEEQPDNYETIDRNYDLNEDYSNRRFDLWKSGLEVYADCAKNIFVGTNFYGMRMYAYEHMPNTYLVNNSHTDFPNFHNEFINILVAQGALGFAVIVWMVSAIIVYVVKNFRKLNSSNSIEFTMAATVILVLALASMFRSGVFYLFSPGAIIFWMFLGYAIMLLEKGKNQED